MSKKVLVISTSLREESNSDALADAFARGAMETGNSVEKVDIIGKDIHFCLGCLVCQKTQHCVIQDDADDITRKMLGADVIVFATPVYFYGISGQMKTLLDRSNPVYASDYKFREIYLLAAAADKDAKAIEGVKACLKGWIDCFAKAKLVKTIFAGGVNDVGEIKGHEALKTAYESGKAV